MKNGKLMACSIFAIIYNLTTKYRLRNMISHLCELTEVSKSGYYNYLNSENQRNGREQRDIQLRDNS